MARKCEVDFTSGKMLRKMILYALPIVGVNVLQLLFTAADVAILGIFTNDQAVAAVGASTPIINLIIGFFMGFSMGINVLLARTVGAKDENKAQRIVGTAIFISIVFGLILLIIGEGISKQLLIWTNCDSAVLPYATTYLRIYFLGMPIIMLYNFSAAILRAVGDTFRPFIFLAIGGVVNVLLNIFFVTVLNLTVEGVAIATVVSNGISGIGAFVLMTKHQGYAKFQKKYFKIHKKIFTEIFLIGLPIAISKCLFSTANVMVQSNLNSLGKEVMAAQSITKEFDGFIVEAVHGFGAANLVVISQNYGAKNMQRVKKASFISLGLMTGVSLFLGMILLVFGRALCSIMTDTETVLEYCVVRINTVSITYMLLGCYSVVQEIIRGIGYSFTSMLINFLGNVILRIVYMTFFYPLLCIAGNTAHNLASLYVLYPISWAIGSLVGFIVILFLFRQVKERFKRESEINKTETNPA